MRTWIASVLTCSWFLLSPLALHVEGAGAVALEVQGERLRIQADDVSLIIILEQLAKTTGIAIHLAEPAQERMSIDLTDVNVEEGMRRLLKHRNTMFLYGQSPSVPSTIYVFGLRGRAQARQTLPLVDTSPDSPVTSKLAEADEVDIEAENRKAGLMIAEIEDTLRTALAGSSVDTDSSIQELMTDSEQSVRITTLQWLSTRRDTGIDAFTQALVSGDDLVQRVAMQLILEQGGDEQEVEAVMAAAEAEDEPAIRHLLSTLLSPTNH